tara:strand:+ start:63 stop:320 length:258 start_codon:yes stop_codon:yes gene_type:complete
MNNKYFIIERVQWSYGDKYEISKGKMFDNLKDATRFLVALETVHSEEKNGVEKTFHLQEVDSAFFNVNEEPLLLTEDMEVNDRSN